MSGQLSRANSNGFSWSHNGHRWCALLFGQNCTMKTAQIGCPNQRRIVGVNSLIIIHVIMKLQLILFVACSSSQLLVNKDNNLATTTSVNNKMLKLNPPAILLSHWPQQHPRQQLERDSNENKLPTKVERHIETNVSELQSENIQMGQINCDDHNHNNDANNRSAVRRAQIKSNNDPSYVEQRQQQQQQQINNNNNNMPTQQKANRPIESTKSVRMSKGKAAAYNDKTIINEIDLDSMVHKHTNGFDVGTGGPVPVVGMGGIQGESVSQSDLVTIEDTEELEMGEGDQDEDSSSSNNNINEFDIDDSGDKMSNQHHMAMMVMDTTTTTATTTIAGINKIYNNTTSLTSTVNDSSSDTFVVINNKHSTSENGNGDTNPIPNSNNVAALRAKIKVNSDIDNNDNDDDDNNNSNDNTSELRANRRERAPQDVVGPLETDSSEKQDSDTNNRDNIHYNDLDDIEAALHHKQHEQHASMIHNYRISYPHMTTATVSLSGHPNEAFKSTLTNSSTATPAAQMKLLQDSSSGYDERNRTELKRDQSTSLPTALIEVEVNNQSMSKATATISENGKDTELRDGRKKSNEVEVTKLLNWYLSTNNSMNEMNAKQRLAILSRYNQYKSNRDLTDDAYYTLLIIYTLLIMVGTIGNGLVCLTVARKPKKMLTSRNLFIVNLAFSDLLLCLFTMPFSFIEISSKYWPMGLITCKLVSGLQATSIFVSTISITAISLDRYKMIVYPTQEALGTLSTLKLVASIWGCALTLSSPLFIWKTIKGPKEDMRDLGFGRIEFCVEQWPGEYGRAIYSFVSMLLQYVVPILIVVIVHAKISTKLQYRMVKKSQQTQLEAHKRRQRRETRKNKILLWSISIIFALSWLPLNIINLVGDVIDPPDFENAQTFKILFALSHAAGCSSAISNPILYGFFNDNFRKEFNEIFTQYCNCCWHLIKRNNQNDDDDDDEDDDEDDEDDDDDEEEDEEYDDDDDYDRIDRGDEERSMMEHSDQSCMYGTVTYWGDQDRRNCDLELSSCGKDITDTKRRRFDRNCTTCHRERNRCQSNNNDNNSSDILRRQLSINSEKIGNKMIGKEKQSSITSESLNILPVPSSNSMGVVASNFGRVQSLKSSSDNNNNNKGNKCQCQQHLCKYHKRKRIESRRLERKNCKCLCHDTKTTNNNNNINKDNSGNQMTTIQQSSSLVSSSKPVAKVRPLSREQSSKKKNSNQVENSVSEIITDNDKDNNRSMLQLSPVIFKQQHSMRVQDIKRNSSASVQSSATAAQLQQQQQQQQHMRKSSSRSQQNTSTSITETTTNTVCRNNSKSSKTSRCRQQQLLSHNWSSEEAKSKHQNHTSNNKRKQQQNKQRKQTRGKRNKGQLDVEKGQVRLVKRTLCPLGKCHCQYVPISSAQIDCGAPNRKRSSLLSTSGYGAALNMLGETFQGFRSQTRSVARSFRRKISLFSQFSLDQHTHANNVVTGSLNRVGSIKNNRPIQITRRNYSRTADRLETRDSSSLTADNNNKICISPDIISTKSTMCMQTSIQHNGSAVTQTIASLNGRSRSLPNKLAMLLAVGSSRDLNDKNVNLDDQLRIDDDKSKQWDSRGLRKTARHNLVNITNNLMMHNDNDDKVDTQCNVNSAIEAKSTIDQKNDAKTTEATTTTKNHNRRFYSRFYKCCCSCQTINRQQQPAISIGVPVVCSNYENESANESKSQQSDKQQTAAAVDMVCCVSCDILDHNNHQQQCDKQFSLIDANKMNNNTSFKATTYNGRTSLSRSTVNGQIASNQNQSCDMLNDSCKSMNEATNNHTVDHSSESNQTCRPLPKNGLRPMTSYNCQELSSYRYCLTPLNNDAAQERLFNSTSTNELKEDRYSDMIEQPCDDIQSMINLDQGDKCGGSLLNSIRPEQTLTTAATLTSTTQMTQTIKDRNESFKKQMQQKAHFKANKLNRQQLITSSSYGQYDDETVDNCCSNNSEIDKCTNEIEQMPSDHFETKSTMNKKQEADDNVNQSGPLVSSFSSASSDASTSGVSSYIYDNQGPATTTILIDTATSRLDSSAPCITTLVPTTCHTNELVTNDNIMSFKLANNDELLSPYIQYSQSYTLSPVITNGSDIASVTTISTTTTTTTTTVAGIGQINLASSDSGIASNKSSNESFVCKLLDNSRQNSIMQQDNQTKSNTGNDCGNSSISTSSSSNSSCSNNSSSGGSSDSSSNGSDCWSKSSPVSKQSSLTSNSSSSTDSSTSNPTCSAGSISQSISMSSSVVSTQPLTTATTTTFTTFTTTNNTTTAAIPANYESPASCIPTTMTTTTITTSANHYSSFVLSSSISLQSHSSTESLTQQTASDLLITSSLPSIQRTNDQSAL